MRPASIWGRLFLASLRLAMLVEGPNLSVGGGGVSIFPGQLGSPYLENPRLDFSGSASAVDPDGKTPKYQATQDRKSHVCNSIMW